MEKVLKKYTSIPNELYVNRNADEQLKIIVDEMQRPGYVLVARQMGKTNLLFNAKRALENDDRLFVYVDLSNYFDLERDCYRNIIDNVIEPNAALFKFVEKEIANLRERSLPSHTEYTKSLRAILNFFKGDIVIVLDEIDALRSAKYSDNIFAQIRSNYFSRTNFPEFERLTYLLSGVIEPTELIKDRNKSPFNIGEKIYLDDFTRKECDSFVCKSGLQIGDEIADKVFDWARGNPRLTFDIYSEIEDLLMRGEIISSSIVDQLIEDKYLRTFDIAPIDHIRELVKSNKQVREAILKMHKSNSVILSDEVKKKLYLYGVINSNSDEQTRFKNKIIEASLSEEWVASVDEMSKAVTITYGVAHLDNREFQLAIDTFDEVLLSTTPSHKDLETINYFLGFSYYNLRQFEKALPYFLRDFTDPTYARNSIALGGICKIALENAIDGIIDLEKVIEKKNHDFAYHSALYNLARNLPKADSKNALALYSELVDSTFESTDRKEDELDILRTGASYYQAEIFYLENNFSEALSKIDDALNYAEISDSVYLLYYKYHVLDGDNKELIYKIVNTIIDNNLQFGKDSHPYSFKEIHLYYYLNLCFDNSNPEDFENLLNYAVENLVTDGANKYKLMLLTCGVSNNSKDIFRYILSFESDIEDDLKLVIYKEYLLKTGVDLQEFFIYFNKYVEIFKQTDVLISNDVYLFALAIKHHSDARKIRVALELCEIVNDRIIESEDEDLKFESVIIYYWYANLYFSLNDKDKAIEYSDKTIHLIDISKKKSTSMIDEEGLLSIVRQMNQIKASASVSSPVINERKYGRNEMVKVQYLDGKIVEGKHKKLEADILAERCKII